MAAPALKPCPVCRGTGSFLGRNFAACDCGMVVERSSRVKAAADWNRLSDLAEARTRAAVRAAMEEAAAMIETHIVSYGQTNVLRPRLEGDRSALEYATAIRAQIARLDAAPSAQPEGGSDADV